MVRGFHSPSPIDLLLESPGFHEIVRGIRMLLPESQFCRFTEEGRIIPFYPLTEEEERSKEEMPCFPELAEFLRTSPEGAEDSVRLERLGDGTMAALCPLVIHSRMQGGFVLAGVSFENQNELAASAILLKEYVRTALTMVAEHDDLELVHELWDAMASTGDVDDLLSVALSQLLRGMDLMQGAIFLVNTQGEAQVRHVGGLGVSNGEPDPIVVCTSECARLRDQAGMAIRIGEESPLWTWTRSAFETNLEEQSLYAIPFTREGDLLGFAVVISSKPLAEHTSERMVLQTLVEGISALIRGLLNMEEAHERHVALRSIHSIHRIMGAASGIQDLVGGVCALMVRAVGADKGSIMLLSEDGKRLEPAARANLEENEIGSFPIQMGQGLPGTVAQTLEWMQIDRLSGPMRELRDPPSAYPNRAYLCIPLTDQALVGVLLVSSNSRDFNSADREILFALMEEIVVAIKNAELVEMRENVHLGVLRTLINLVETREAGVSGRSGHVYDLSLRVARRLEVRDQPLLFTQYAALLYHTGSLFLSESDGGKEMESAEEARRTGYDRHVDLSRQTAERVVAPMEIHDIISHHHERYDGSGYPDQLKERQIPLGSRIIACCDYYVSRVEILLSSGEGDRSQVLEETGAFVGKHFDPKVFEALKAEVESLPEGQFWPDPPPPSPLLFG